jgi:hypothetical protein
VELLNSPIPLFHLSVAPNPSSQWARLAWTIVGDPGQLAPARLEVFDFQGRRIRSLVDGLAAAGPHESFWDGRNEHGDLVPAGIYWLRLTYGDHTTSTRLVRMAARL